MKNNGMTYDVVILTHAPRDEFVLSLEKIITQKIMPQKIIIYNTDESIFLNNIDKKDKLDRIFKDNKSLIDIINIDENDFDHGKSRNDASKLCKSKYILFMTDDAVAYDDKLTQNLMEAFDKYNSENQKVAAVYARQIARDDAKLKEKYVREFNYPDYDIIKDKSKESLLGIKNYFCSNVCAMYDREIFEKEGRFEENIILNEDTFYVHKVINDGYSIVYSSNSIVIHSHNYSYSEQFSRNFDIGVSQSEKDEIFSKIPSKKEGKKLVFYVVKKLVKGLHFIMCIDFIIECFYRYLGFSKGKKYKNLTIDKCIKYATNKKYFEKKKK